MVRIVKFRASALQIGPLEGEVLLRILFVSFVISISIFFFKFYGMLSLLSIPLFLLKSQYDFLDQALVKKLKGDSVVGLVPINVQERAVYEIFGVNYGLSEVQDQEILNHWSQVINSLTENVTVIRYPYRIPTDHFTIGIEEYDSLFSCTDSFADAYFLSIDRKGSEILERALSSSGISFRLLSKEEVEKLNDLI
jgi:hypothetical protein